MKIAALHFAGVRNLATATLEPAPRFNVFVGDNGQGKTTFLRTVVDSLKPLAGEVRWGYGCQVGVYAQHVYTSLPEGQTVLAYLRQQAARGK